MIEEATQKGDSIMDQIWPAAPTAKEAKEIEATLRQYLTQMKSMNHQMEVDQTHIERLKQETSLIREKSERVGDETRFLLKSLASLDLWNSQKGA